MIVVFLLKIGSIPTFSHMPQRLNTWASLTVSKHSQLEAYLCFILSRRELQVGLGEISFR
jgi:hypothetical protein